MFIRNVFLAFFLAGGLIAQDNQVSVAFKDLPRLLEQSSLQQSILRSQRAMITIKRNTALQWSNPELNYEREEVEANGSSEREEGVYLSKTFSLPWNYWQERSIWESEINAADFNYRQDSNELLATVKSEYVRLGLLQDLLEKQKSLITIVKEMSQIVNARREEGAISELEATLLSISVFGLEADIIKTQKAYRRVMNHLKQMLGISHSAKVHFVTPIIFIDIATTLSQLSGLPETHTGMQALQMGLAATDSRISLERSNILPSISIEGGYKKVNPDWEGYTLGLSIPLPVLNLNGPQIEEQKIKYRIQSAQVSMYRQKLQIEIYELIETIRASIELLRNRGVEQQSIKIADDLTAAYQEGAISLTEFLNAIQLYRDGISQYAEQLAAYYEAVFKLEIHSGQQLIKF